MEAGFAPRVGRVATARAMRDLAFGKAASLAVVEVNKKGERSSGESSTTAIPSASSRHFVRSVLERITCRSFLTERSVLEAKSRPSGSSMYRPGN
jgi:hypothetical protein